MWWGGSKQKVETCFHSGQFTFLFYFLFSPHQNRNSELRKLRHLLVTKRCFQLCRTPQIQCIPNGSTKAWHRCPAEEKRRKRMRPWNGCCLVGMFYSKVAVDKHHKELLQPTTLFPLKKIVFLFFLNYTRPPLAAPDTIMTWKQLFMVRKWFPFHVQTRAGYHWSTCILIQIIGLVIPLVMVCIPAVQGGYYWFHLYKLLLDCNVHSWLQRK